MSIKCYQLVLMVAIVASFVSGQLDEPPSAAEGGDTVLKFLQVVFRHGDRAPLLKQVPNDPYRDDRQYWPFGLTQLTRTGRSRMFRMGEWIRARYADYLGKEFSPREVIARSSASDRCLETIQLVLAGSYPPTNPKWQWDIQNYPLPLGRVWQAVAISSFLPMDEDTLLRVKKYCPKADREVDRLYTAPEIDDMIEADAELLDKLSRLGGKPLINLDVIDEFWENLNIEHLNGYYWHDQANTTEWTAEFEDEVYRRLKKYTQERWNREFASPFVQRMRAGELLHTIGENFVTAKSVLGDFGPQTWKVNYYSTHDTKLSAMMHALDVWQQGQLIPFGATMLFELHQSVANPMEHFVRILYMNETMSLLEPGWEKLRAHPLSLPFCGGRSMCPIERYLELVERHLKPGNWNDECGIKPETHAAMGSFCFVGSLANIFLFFILLFCVMHTWNQRGGRGGYEKLK